MPFCRHRCGYCDFTLVAGRDDLIADYLQALRCEIPAAVPGRIDLDTLFLGGGTPSHLSPAETQQLVDILAGHFRLTDGAEFSIEANPADITADRVALWADAGINRVSLGVQSFDSDALRILERDHNADVVLRSVSLLRERIDNVALDLIFAVPGQSVSTWESTLHQAIAPSPESRFDLRG